VKAFPSAIWSSFVVVTLFVVGLASQTALAADSGASGRRHAAKANQLAAKNKCKGAVVEFTKAYKSLKDPAILFNRAECQRKLGNNAGALKDYEQFLTDMPTAPNRASVEARMASLREAMKAEPAVVPAVPALPSATAAPAAAGASPPAPPASEEAKQEEKAPESSFHPAERWAD
jgi:hypothetical protein